MWAEIRVAQLPFPWDGEKELLKLKTISDSSFQKYLCGGLIFSVTHTALGHNTEWTSGWLDWSWDASRETSPDTITFAASAPQIPGQLWVIIKPYTLFLSFGFQKYKYLILWFVVKALWVTKQHKIYWQGMGVEALGIKRKRDGLSRGRGSWNLWTQMPWVSGL